VGKLKYILHTIDRKFSHKHTLLFSGCFVHSFVGIVRSLIAHSKAFRDVTYWTEKKIPLGNKGTVAL